MVEEITKSLYLKYIRKNSAYPVSYGSFHALKPFYIRHATLKDIEMCCCKKHLHARWSIDVLAEYSKRNGVDQPFNNYESFFQHVFANCRSQEQAHKS